MTLWKISWSPVCWFQAIYQYFTFPPTHRYYSVEKVWHFRLHSCELLVYFPPFPRKEGNPQKQWHCRETSSYLSVIALNTLCPVEHKCIQGLDYAYRYTQTSYKTQPLPSFFLFAGRQWKENVVHKVHIFTQPSRQSVTGNEKRKSRFFFRDFLKIHNFSFVYQKFINSFFFNNFW